MAEGQIILKLAGLTSEHPTTQAATAELLTDLRSEPNLRTRQQDKTAESGTKGATVEIIVSLTTSGSLASIVRILKVWLSRDRRRSLTVAIRETPNGKVISVEGDLITVDALTAAIKSAAPTGQKQNSQAKGQPKKQH